LLQPWSPQRQSWPHRNCSLFSRASNQAPSCSVPTCGSVGLANHVKWWPCGHSTEDGRTIVTLDGADDKDGRSDKVIRWPGPGLGVFFLFYFTSAVSVNDVTDTGFTNTTN
jgi:hypothetical protein